MELPLTFENLLDLYDEKPVIKSLIQLLIPSKIATIVDNFLTPIIQKMHKERTKTFFDELATGKIILTHELIQSEEFLHCYFATAKAAQKTYRREKIKCFSRLLKSSTLPDTFSSIDEYEEFLGVLDELSYREILILSTLYRYETRMPLSAKYDEYRRAKYFWKDFIDEIIENNKIGIREDEIHSILTRMSRTGCYEPMIGLGTSGGKGKLTPLFYRLIKYIQEESDMDLS